MFILNLIVGVVLFGLIALILFLYNQTRKHAKYFQDRNVPYIGAGGMRLFRLLSGKISLIELECEVYKEAIQTGAPFIGFSDNFLAPAYYITDLDLTRHIYVKDFDHFVNRRTLKTKNSEELLQKMMLSLENDEWKGMRGKLSPTFTTGKIRKMFNIFDRSGHRMCQYLEKIVGPAGSDHDICEVYSKYAMDVIASCAFGVDSKSFDCPPGTKSEFETMAQEIQFNFKPMFFFKFLLLLFAPKVGDALGITAFDPVPQNYFRKVIKGVMQHRREKGERQDDFLQLMMDAQDGLLKDEENSKESLEVSTGSPENEAKTTLLTDEGSTTKLKLDDESIVANCVLFLIGGFDTLQSLLIYTAFSLALEQEVQDKLFREVQDALEKNNGKLTYETLIELNYLDMVINETLRYLSPAPRTERKCTKDYKIPGTDIVIEKGQIVGMPVFAMQRDPRYYENPDKFDPDRFLPENKSKRHPYSFAPFGHGPRNCIGMRFALTEVKAVIATLVHKFKLEPCHKTGIPPKFSSSFTLKPANGMWLNIRPRDEE